jgi:hypothetical protein
MLVNFKNLINDEYARDISRKVKSVYKTKQRKGEYIASAVPFGYVRDENDKHHLVIDKEAADTVKLIFEFALNDKSAYHISSYLNERGILTPLQYRKKNGRPYKNNTINDENIDNLKWNTNSVSNILTNEVYTGSTIQNKKIKMSYKIKKNVAVEKEKWIKVEDTHEAIVSKEDYDWIQEKYYTKIIQVKNNYEYALFSGFLICADCHRGFCFCNRKRKSGNIYNFYQCGNYRMNKSFCTPHTISEDKIKEITIASINKHIKLVQNLKDKLQIISSNKKESVKIDVLNSRKNEIEQEIDLKMKLKQSLYTDWKEDIITYEDYKNYSDNYNEKIIELRKSLDIIKDEIEEYENIPDSNIEMMNLFSISNMVKDINRDILFKMIDKIIIYDKNKIEICFRYADIYNSIRKYINNNNEFLVC